MSLDWIAGDRYHQRSACGRFTVAKTFVGGEAKYSAWRVGGGPVDNRYLGTFLTADQAKRKAAEDAQA